MNKFSDYFPFLSIREHESLKRWYQLSLILLSCLMAALIAATGAQWWQIHALSIKKKNLLSSTGPSLELQQKIEHLKKEKEEFASKLHVLKEFQESTSHVKELLNYIARTIPADVALDQIHYQHDKEILISGRARSAQALNEFIAATQKNSRCKNIVVNSINQSQESSTKQPLIIFKLIVSQS